MSKKPYLNVGCGSKYHVDWTNIDMKSSSAHVQAHNLLQGFPYRSDCFEAVYHSQVLEHFPREKAPGFLGECLRVLKPRGIIRVVVPDLENIAKEYLGHLAENLEHPSELARANYDWIMLELYDQTVRDRSGGRMAEFLSQPGLVNESYVFTRSGRVARNIIEKSRSRLRVPETGEEASPLHLTDDQEDPTVRVQTVHRASFDSSGGDRPFQAWRRDPPLDVRPLLVVRASQGGRL